MTEPKWAEISDEELLKTRISDLGLTIVGTELEANVKELHQELEARGLVFHPPCYLADEWLCPDLEPIIGIPFYLAHPRLKKLEKKIILEVEGETKSDFMKLLRHEAGHAYNYAYRFYKKNKWKELFGSFSQEYPDTYIPRPYSKKYVRHIENCYAQYHPDEDFAETFAVWLSPDRNWREEYKDWKIALAKLEYVDQLMKNIRGKLPLVTSNKKYWAAEKMKQTLEYYYKKRSKEYVEVLPGFFDPDLKRIFREVGTSASIEKADQFMTRHRKKIVDSISMWTGKNKYVVNKLIKNLISIAKNLGLSRFTNEDTALLELTAYIDTMVINYLFTGRLKHVRKKMP